MTRDVSAVRRRERADQTGRCAVLYPALAEAARRDGRSRIGLVDVGRPAGLNLTVDRVGISYGAGVFVGDRSSPVQHSASVVGDRPVPVRVLPEVVARVEVDRDPLDVTEAGDVARLRADLDPADPERRVRLDAELALAATDPPLLLRGDPMDLLPDALARVPAGALPVVITTWTLSRLSVPKRRRFLDRLVDASTTRPVAWVSVEGVGVAPSIPTLGDRPASGHSIIGLTVVEGAAVHSEALGRCWSRGRMLSWLATV